jgi:hypothetical protein
MQLTKIELELAHLLKYETLQSLLNYLNLEHSLQTFSFQSMA